MRRLRKSTLQTILVALVIICVLTGAYFTAYRYNMKEMRLNFEEERTKYQDELRQNQRNYYKAVTTIESGELITEENVVLESGYASMAADLLLKEEAFGKPARIEITAGSILTADMVAEEAVPDELREEEFGCIYLSSNLKEGDTVDVRLLFPNGENYIVLAKKELHTVTLHLNNCFLWMDEKETLLMSSAVVDAYLREGAVLYTTKYVEASLQEASEVTYPPNADVIRLMEADPNIVKEAKQGLEIRLREELEERLKTETKGGESEDSYSGLVEEKESLGQYLHGEGIQNKAEPPEPEPTGEAEVPGEEEGSHE